jgi:hypothetical protein
MPLVAPVSFQALERWDYPCIKACTYAYVDDTDIEAALRAPDLAAFELAASWSALTSNHSTRQDNPIHPRIIAKLVLELRQGSIAPPVTIIAEQDIRKRCGYCVSDGHHRLRAFQFLQLPTFSAVCRGEQAAVQRLFDLCATV